MPNDYLFTVHETGRARKRPLPLHGPVRVPGAEPTPEELAGALVIKLKAEILMGTKYYHPRTGEPLTTPKQIVECLLAEAEVIFSGE